MSPLPFLEFKSASFLLSFGFDPIGNDNFDFFFLLITVEKAVIITMCYSTHSAPFSGSETWLKTFSCIHVRYSNYE